ncbi:MAG: hypothetical protein RI580_18615, partial [Halothece sp. Uz-M2-17]|nr:hypothetical protein [Halothece sp. Uz-M2-17]
FAVHLKCYQEFRISSTRSRCHPTELSVIRVEKKVKSSSRDNSSYGFKPSCFFRLTSNAVISYHNC